MRVARRMRWISLGGALALAAAATAATGAAEASSPVAARAATEPTRLKLCLTDWRNPGRWTGLDRARRADLVSCSPRWSEPPIPGVPTLVAACPAFLLLADTLLAIGDFHGDLGRRARARGETLIGGRERVLWRHEGQTLISLDVRNERAMRELAAWFVDRFPWAQGIHLDYFSSPCWMEEFADLCAQPRFARRWDAGLAALARELHRLRPDWIVLGVQFHEVPIEAHGAINGRFIEQSPTSFGMTLDRHRLEIERHRSRLAREHADWPVTFVVELEDPARYPRSYIDEVVELCRSTGTYLSWGRGQRASVGAP